MQLFIHTAARNGLLLVLSTIAGCALITERTTYRARPDVAAVDAASIEAATGDTVSVDVPSPEDTTTRPDVLPIDAPPPFDAPHPVDVQPPIDIHVSLDVRPPIDIPVPIIDVRPPIDIPVPIADDGLPTSTCTIDSGTVSSCPMPATRACSSYLAAIRIAFDDAVRQPCCSDADCDVYVSPDLCCPGEVVVARSRAANCLVNLSREATALGGCPPACPERACLAPLKPVCVAGACR
jgi:hypothetical protein